LNPTKRHTVFSVVIGGFFYWASLLCVNQATVQKAMSLRSLAKAKIAITLSVFGLATLFFINFYTGWMMFAHYEKCDPLKAGKVGGQDQLMPFYIMDTFGSFTAFSGIFVAGVFSASLGTVAACLSSLSAVTLEDLCISGMNVKISPQDATRYAKWLNFGYGVLSFGLIFLVEGRGILQATLTLNGLIGGIALGLFSLGIFFKTANLKGALYGGLLSTFLVITLGIFALTYNEDAEYLELSVEECSCIVNSTMSSLPVAAAIEQSSEPWYTYIYKVSYMWYSMIGTILTIVLGLLASVITQWISEMKIKKISAQIPKNHSGVFRSNSSQAPERKISTIAHDATAKIESTIRKAMSSGHLSHYNTSRKDEDTLNIVNECSIQSTIGNNACANNASVIQMFDDGIVFEANKKRGIDNMAMDIGGSDIDIFKK
jgi:Na+/proline symporter